MVKVYHTISYKTLTNFLQIEGSKKVLIKLVAVSYGIMKHREQAGNEPYQNTYGYAG